MEGRLAPQMWGPCSFVSGACRHHPQLPVTSVPSRRSSRFGGNGTRGPGRAHVAGEEASPFPSDPGAGCVPGTLRCSPAGPGAGGEPRLRKVEAGRVSPPGPGAGGEPRLRKAEGGHVFPPGRGAGAEPRLRKVEGGRVSPPGPAAGVVRPAPDCPHRLPGTTPPPAKELPHSPPRVATASGCPQWHQIRFTMIAN